MHPSGSTRSLPSWVTAIGARSPASAAFPFIEAVTKENRPDYFAGCHDPVLLVDDMVDSLTFTVAAYKLRQLEDIGTQ